jgi:hypothetical protein
MIKKYGPNDVVTFGKHRGKHIHEIASEDPTYITWMLDSIPAFYITPEDMFSLMLQNQELKLVGDQLPNYKRKHEMFEIQFIKNRPHLDALLWSKLKTTRKNNSGYKRLKSLQASYQPCDINILLSRLVDDECWQYCQLAVDTNGCPMIRVFVDLSKRGHEKEQSEAARMVSEGLLQLPPLARLEMNMDMPGFGALAYRLVELGLLKTSKIGCNA